MQVSGGPTDGRRCAFVGDEPLVAQCVDVALAQGLDVVLVATSNRLVHDHAAERGIASVGSIAELGAGLDDHPAEVLFSIANLRLVPDDVLACVSTAINFHDGPLPGYAGLNVTSWALLAGEDEHAITWHLMTSDVDDGEIVAVEPFRIDIDETAFSLNARCYEAALATFPSVASAVAAGALVTTPQPEGTRRVFMRHDRPAEVFDPARPAADTVRAVRALDLGHRLRNSIGAVRWIVGQGTDGGVLVIDSATVAADPSGQEVGTVVTVDDTGVRIATSDGDVVVTGLSTASGRSASPGVLAAEFGVVPGAVLASPAAALVAAISEVEPSLSKGELFWIDRAAWQEPTSLIAARDGLVREVRVDAPRVESAAALAAVALWMSRTSGSGTVSFALSDAASRDTMRRTAPLTRPSVAVIDLEDVATFGQLRELAATETQHVAGRGPLLHDAIGRDPRTRGRDLGATVVVDLEAASVAVPASGDVTLRISIGDEIRLSGSVDPEDPAFLERAAEQLAALLRSVAADPGAPLAALEAIGATEQAALDAFNATELEYDRAATVATLFHDQARRTPDEPAASFGDRTVTYTELEAAAAAVGRRLAAAGVGRHDRVGIAVPRGLDMLAGVIATLDLGAAYVPLDPTYPVDRLRFMVEDSGIKALFATGSAAAELGQPGIAVVDPTMAGPPEAASAVPIAAHDPADLAYVIYTSGSTGKPKGVMLEHREVTNFFAAMDQVIDTGDGREGSAGVWLAVTSLSFDISVLELLWTVTRGFHVVIKADRGIPIQHGGVTVSRGTRPVTFSLFYFAAGEETAADGYRLLLDSARFADANGFEAVWTPERHFHAFGGAYPNPSVAGAALAAITKNVAIRAGSVVLPLHSPIRVAEEWAVVDNISQGRVGISFAAGWQPNDFVLNPGAYATAKEDLPQRIDTVQRLWRGETVSLPGHDGGPVDVRTLPRPVQGELPTWLTSAGSPATFERAGTLGVNVLTHLLGQSIDQLTENVQRYRDAWRASGHPGEGRVTLMMHTYLDRDSDAARETAREPMKAYLSTAVGLLRDVASAFPTFAGRGKNTDDLFKSLSAEEMDQLLEVAAHRYLSTSGLFGTPADVADVVEQVSVAGVDEVACLIDFGVQTDLALRSLDLLLEAKDIVDAARGERPAAAAGTVGHEIDPARDTVAALVAEHGVTHLQCTPSLAAMLVADPADRAALGRISHLMVGGEALATALAAELRSLLPGRFTNMYGPTETTIWSLVHEIGADIGASIPIGAPIANTTIHVLDRDGCRLGVGAFGELHIGGEGVARGYHNRPELTAERFVDRPGMGRVYATGDVARLHPAGYVEFAGRADNQVKIRGHRIELGEIETVIDRHPDVVQSVVVARSDGGDLRVVAYAVVRHRADTSPQAFADDVRKFVGEVLPDVMVPATVVRLDAFPLTPNGKIDRKALPAPPSGLIATDLGEPVAPPADDIEQLVADVWIAELERPVGRDDNFFDIGGHSLLAVKVFRRLSDAVPETIALTDIFRFPTVRTFAAHLGALRGTGGDAPDAATAAPAGADRGTMRRRAMARRGSSQE